MRRIERSAIVPYPADAMFDLVADVASYPEFLPGCIGARICSGSRDDLIASIALAEGPLRIEFRTHNRSLRPCYITMELDQGPFRHLSGRWDFEPLDRQGSKVSLSIEFAFAGRVADKLFGSAFEMLCNRLVDAFIDRARSVYAPQA